MGLRLLLENGVVSARKLGLGTTVVTVPGAGWRARLRGGQEGPEQRGQEPGNHKWGEEDLLTHSKGAELG